MKRDQVFFLILITVIVYSNTLQNEFISDDKWLINDHYITSLKNVPFFFSVEYWFEHNPLNRPYICRPLRAISLSLDYALWGYNPMGYHFTNLICHLINVILVYVLILNLLLEKKLAFWVALLFAVHPVNTEAVVWIKNRAELLGSMFALGSLILFIKGFQKKSVDLRFYSPAYLFFYLAISAKETYIVLPLIIIAYLICFQQLNFKTLGILFLFFVIIVIHPVFLTLTNLFSHQTRFENLLPTILLGIIALIKYLGLLFWPVNLNAQHASLDYSLDISMLPGIAFLGGLLFLLFRQSGFLSFAVSWILITLAPVLIMIPVILRPFAEQRLYSSTLGFCMLVVSLSKSKILPLLLTFLAVIYCIATFQRNFIWKTEVSILEDCVKKDLANARMHYHLAWALLQEGAMIKGLRHYATALELEPQTAGINFKKVLQDSSENFPVFNALIKDDYTKLKTELDSDPKNVILHYFMGNIFAKLGDSAMACSEYKKALKSDPAFSRALNKLAAIMNAER